MQSPKTAHNGHLTLQNKIENLPPRVVMVSVLLGTLTVSLNNSALNPAVPEFMKTFDTGPLLASWIVAGFMMAMGLTMPLTGYLSNRYGKRRLYLIGLGLFVCGSSLGALAPGINWVIAARIVQGIAGGLMIPLSLPLIFSVYEKEKRGRITGIWGTAVMLAPAVGPFVGGLALELASWQVLFIMNIPFGLSAFVVALVGLPTGRQDANDRQPFDTRGFLSATLAIAVTMMWLNLLSEEILPVLAMWGLPILAVFAFAYFIRTERKSPAPLLDLGLFTYPCYRISIVITTIQSVGMFVTLILIPLQLQTVMGYGPVWTGAALLCTAVSGSIFVNIGGRWLDWHGPRLTVTTGLVITGIAAFLLAASDANTPLWGIFALMILRGIGLGLSYMPVTTAGLNAIPENRLTQGAAMNNISRRILSSAGIVIASAYLEWHRQTHAPAAQEEMAAISQVFLATGLLIAGLLPLACHLPSKVFVQAPVSPKPDL